MRPRATTLYLDDGVEAHGSVTFGHPGTYEDPPESPEVDGLTLTLGGVELSSEEIERRGIDLDSVEDRMIEKAYDENEDEHEEAEEERYR